VDLGQWGEEESPKKGKEEDEKEVEKMAKGSNKELIKETSLWRIKRSSYNSEKYIYGIYMGYATLTKLAK